MRLDTAVGVRGLARSRTHAVSLITAGHVFVEGRRVLKPSARVDEGANIVVLGADHYVSRGAHKLIAALDAFAAVQIDGAIALDVGASTGGFTQVLCERGARLVVALDVGHDQVASEVAADERVRVVEGINVRELTRESLTVMCEGSVPTLVVGDVSFISLTHVIPPLREAVGAQAEYVVLVKPQFEVGRSGVRGGGGVVRDFRSRANAVFRVLCAAWEVGLGTAGVISSPIVGEKGNCEYFVWLNKTGQNPTEWVERISKLVGE